MEGYSYFFNIWPWMGLGAAVVMLILLFCTDWLRMDPGKKRWEDPYWLSWVFMVCYMLHNIEEYGLSLTGAHNGFPDAMAVIFGQPLPEYFFLTVNFSIVWLAAPLAASLARKKKWPVLATGMAGFMMANSLTHVVSGIAGGYNPGLLTACCLFIPIAIWTYCACFGKGGIQKSALWWNLGIGFLYHAIMFGSILTEKFTGSLSMPLVTLILGLDAILMFWLWVVLQKKWGTVSE